MFFIRKKYCPVIFRDKGSTLITLIVIMVIFAVLAAAIYSLTSSSMFGQINTLSTTRATYLAKSGYNYLASQYKHVVPATEVARNQKLEDLNNKTFTLLNNEGSFHLNVKPYYLVSQDTLTIDNTNNLRLRVKFSGDVSYAIPNSGTMAVYTANGWRRFYYTSVNTLGVNSYELRLANNPNPPEGTINVVPGTSIVPVFTTPNVNPDQTLTHGGSLRVTDAGDIYPARFGFFEIPQDDTEHVYTYNYRTGDIFYGVTYAHDPSEVFSSFRVRDGRRIYAHTSAEITSTGTVSFGLSPAVSSTFSRPAILGYKVGGNSDNVPHNIPGVDGWVTIGTGVAIDTGDQIVELGLRDDNTAGVTWYAGDSDSANCEDGLCDFGVGIRAYFQFRDTDGSSSSGDGFMFMIMNGTNNDTTKRGGTPSGAGMGELMGYAGPGNSTDGLGLQPPKISIEFDRYRNSGVSSPPGCGFGRNDASGNHMALMFWGDNTAGNCSNGYPAASYDDNVHEVPAIGTPSSPRNSFSGDGTGGYYATSFADDDTRSFRIEVTRAVIPNGSGNYEYNVKAWLWMGNCTGTNCDDVSVAYSDSTPQINRTIEITPTLHAYFNKMFFGFTQGTGSATQDIEVSDFDIYFPPY